MTAAMAGAARSATSTSTATGKRARQRRQPVGHRHLARRGGAGLSARTNPSSIGLDDGAHGTIPFSELHLGAQGIARTPIVGAAPTAPAGRAQDRRRHLCRADRRQAGRITACARCPKSTAPSWRWTRIPAACWRMSGGFSYASSQFDRAMQAMRQPGSSFKPFVYAAALDNGYTPVSKVLDAPVRDATRAGPADVDGRRISKTKFLGLTTLRRGIELSRNLMTIRLASDHRHGQGRATMPMRFGVYDKLPPYLANSLGAVRNDADAHDHRLFRIRQWRQEDQRLADRPHPGPQRQDHLAPRHARLRGLQRCRSGTTSPSRCSPTRASRSSIRAPPIRSSRMLEGVVQRGTGVRCSAVGKPLAGKTGTSTTPRTPGSSASRPIWRAGVFVGFDNPRTLGTYEQGATAAAPIFRDFMKGALATCRRRPFRVAAGHRSCARSTR